MSEWESVIGLEIHVQLKTRTKMFCACEVAYFDPPNTHTCPVCLAHPGALPVANARAIEETIKLGLALGCEIAPRALFHRKNYFYPDLPKGYQISQYETPIVQGGEIAFFMKDEERAVRLTRAHLEEDAGKSLHEDFHGMTGIDLNRAGTALLEIVSEPELRGAKEAVAYARALHALVTWIGICDGNMQEGSFRCDANVSVRRAGDKKLGTRCEIKNLNSFRFMERAIEFEARRQIELLEDGKSVMQETRLYDPERDETRSMRTKEDAQDYRYFPDPDLLPLVVTEDMIERIRKTMPKLPDVQREELVVSYSLTSAQASQLTATRATSTFALAAFSGAPSTAWPVLANWINGPLAAKLNEEDIEIEKSRISSEQLRILAIRMDQGVLSGKMAKEVFDAVWSGEGDVDSVIEKRGLKQISDSGEIEKLVDEVLAANSKQVQDYRAGKEKAFNSLVGQVMKATRGKANPAQVNELLKKKLG